MKVTVEHDPAAENEVVLRCASLDDEMLRVLSLLRPEEGEWKRTALWAALANLIFAAGGWGLHWFSGVPVWGAFLLLLFLELALGAMWYALRLQEKRDTAALNRCLRQLQEEI